MPAKEPSSLLESKLNHMERTLEVHSARMDAIDQKLAKIADLVEANTQKVASFSEGVTRLEISISRLERVMERGFTRLETMMAQQLELTRQQHDSIQIQSRHVDRLMGVVETLLTKVA